jgi:hypothetical protein
MKTLVSYKDTTGKVIENISFIGDYCVVLFNDNSFCMLNAIYVDDDYREYKVHINDGFRDMDSLKNNLINNSWNGLDSEGLVTLGILTQKEIDSLLEEARLEKEARFKKHKDSTLKQRYEEYLKLKEEFDPKPKF